MGKTWTRAVFGSVTFLLASAAFAASGLAGNVVRPARTVVPLQQHQMLLAAQALQGIEFPTTTRALVGKAQPDECFVAPLDPGNEYPATMPCGAGARPKVNQGYAWSMTEAAGNIWFGTVSNPLCAVVGGFLGVNADIETNSFVC